MQRLMVVLAVALGLAACTPDWATLDQASVLMRVVSVAGDQGGDSTDTWVVPLHSDVVSDAGGVWNDNAQLIIEVVAKNPEAVSRPMVSGVRLQRYRVAYTRSDGRNVEGVDVPYAIEGPMTAFIPVDGSTEAVIEVVRHAAKEEPPLRNLRGDNGESIITCIATITVHGVTGEGHVVEDSGTLQIDFADFGG